MYLEYIWVKQSGICIQCVVKERVENCYFGSFKSVKMNLISEGSKCKNIASCSRYVVDVLECGFAVSRPPRGDERTVERWRRWWRRAEGTPSSRIWSGSSSSIVEQASATELIGIRRTTATYRTESLNTIPAYVSERMRQHHFHTYTHPTKHEKYIFFYFITLTIFNSCLYHLIKIWLHFLIWNSPFSW